jgi:hypothetical protein
MPAKTNFKNHLIMTYCQVFAIISSRLLGGDARKNGGKR